MEEANAGPSTIADSAAAQIRTEAANVVASLAHGETTRTSFQPSYPANILRLLGPREVLFGLLEADAHNTIFDALTGLSERDPVFLRIAVVRALRALFVAIADCTGPSLWNLGEECPVKRRSEMRSVLDVTFQASLQRNTQACLLLIKRIDSGSRHVPSSLGKLDACH